MVLDNAVGREVEDVLLKNEALWLDRVPPELEWDESDLALVVRDLVGRSQVRNYA